MERVVTMFLAAAALTSACSSLAPPSDVGEPGQVFTVRGEVVGKRFEGQALRIRHEEIPGFMDVMTMDFRLKDPTEAETIQAGDKIRFRYVADGVDSFIDQIEVLDPSTSLHLSDDDSGQDHEHEH